MQSSELDYAELNKTQKQALTDPCTEYTARQAIRHCLSQSQVGSSVLDYGCCTGRASRVFKQHGFRVTGVDVIEERLEQAAKVCDSTFLRLNMKTPLPFDKAQFSLVFAAQLIEHLCHCDARDFIHEVYEILKPGGKMFLSTPNPHYIRLILQRRPMIADCHLSCWSIEDLKHAFSVAGFHKARHCGNGRTALYIGESFPCRWVYGGIAVMAEKPLEEEAPTGG